MLFGSSGIRRRYNLPLAELSLSLGSALAATASEVVVGMDTRTSSPILADAAVAGLLSGGARVTFGNIAPTPTVAFAARTFDAGLMITASHNPEEYNGLKVFNPDGSSFTPSQQESLEQQMMASEGKGWECQGDMEERDLLSGHRDAILSHREVSRGPCCGHRVRERCRVSHHTGPPLCHGDLHDSPELPYRGSFRPAVGAPRGESGVRG